MKAGYDSHKLVHELYDMVSCGLLKPEHQSDIDQRPVARIHVVGDFSTNITLKGLNQDADFHVSEPGWVFQP